MCRGIGEEQGRLLESWLGAFSVVRDCSWPLQDTTVLHVLAQSGEEFIVKASTTSHHIRREIAAHGLGAEGSPDRTGSAGRTGLAGLEGLAGRVPELRHASAEAGILVTGFLPGTLVEGTPAEDCPETYRQAGTLLRRLHRSAGTSTQYAKALTAKTWAWLDRAHGLVPEPHLTRLAEELSALEPGMVQLVSTHGDYQPRNWLQENGRVKVIDFGRADARPWVHDLVRLSHQQFVGRPDLAAAFYDGLGKGVGPAEAAMWRLENLNQAIGAVVWANQVGDTAFEQAGRAMVERVLST